VKLRLGLLIAFALLVAACGGDDAGGTTTGAPETTVAAVETTTTVTETTTAPETTEAPAAGQTVALATSDLGEIIVDASGNTLYLFVPDEMGASTCYDACESNWPPLVGEISAGAGVDDSLLGVAARDDGLQQVTYGGWPLYYFANDASPGDVNGQGVNDVWFVLGPDGHGIGIPDMEAAGDTVSVASSDLGDILVDGSGNTLYLFVPDDQGASTCYDDCEANWPPLVADVAAGEGADGALLGTVARDDGSAQVTYNGWPLYYFVNDAAPGDVNGQGINEVWYVVSGAGEAVAG
jgi:predicted lipoprotein with Yx(FWY)xxD motif